jgi:[methyl-Co(III) methanol-specific corrinoid protein]:coenzyme M methyltransferase
MVYGMHMSCEIFLQALTRRSNSSVNVFGAGTSIVCRDLMNAVGTHFPEAHLDPEKMAALAIAGHTHLGLDVVMPLFSVCHEASAMGCNVNWGDPTSMPESGKPIFKSAEDIRIPADLLQRPGCTVPLKAISFLKKRLGNDAAVCGKVFGSWTQAYHYFGVEDFLMLSATEPDATRRILEKLTPVTLAFAQAQIDAGADCLLLGDHATRDLCSPATYRNFLLDLHRELASRIKAPLILHICGNTGDRIPMIAQTRIACFHWDTKTGPAAEVRKLAGDRMALMGGISNRTLLQGPPEAVVELARQASKAGIDIIGPECAIPLTTPLPNLKAITSIGRKKQPG